MRFQHNVTLLLGRMDTPRCGPRRWCGGRRQRMELAVQQRHDPRAILQSLLVAQAPMGGGPWCCYSSVAARSERRPLARDGARHSWPWGGARWGSAHSANGDMVWLWKGPRRGGRMSSQAATVEIFFRGRSAAYWEPRPHGMDGRG
jgi:hypothetical protein